MRVIVTGSRGFGDSAAIKRELEKLPLGTTIVHGDCPSGADALARYHVVRANLNSPSRFAEERHHADWHQHGKRAGYLRNAEMAALGADLCLAFWDGESRGTKHMIECAERAGILVRIVREKESV